MEAVDDGEEDLHDYGDDGEGVDGSVDSHLNDTIKLFTNYS